MADIVPVHQCDLVPSFRQNGRHRAAGSLYWAQEKELLMTSPRVALMGMILESNRARARYVQPAKNVQKRGLAAPGCPKDDNKLTGKERDVTTGWDYFSPGRYYLSLTNRWMQVDPLAEKYYSNSPYHFSGNNPILFIDSDGMSYDDYFNKA